jgi:hypothetical protein
MQRRVKAEPRSRSAGYATIGGWLGRLASLDFAVFEDIQKERTATAGAILIVLGASIFAGFGSWIWALQHSEFQGLDGVEVFLKTVLAGGLLQTGVWFLWVYMAYFVLHRGFAAQVTFPELMRSMGLAFAPVALSLLVAIAPLAVPFGILSLGAAFLFTNFAIETTADVTTRESTFANLAGFGTFLIFMGALANVMEAGTFGGLAPGLLFFSLDL